MAYIIWVERSRILGVYSQIFIQTGNWEIMQPQHKTMRDYIYSSEMTAREKLSLKNLLAQQPGLQRNFLSQQSQRAYRTTARPQTMYGERARALLNEQSQKTKLQTQIKMRRQQSSYKITRSNSGVEIKTVANEDKIKMKKALGRINLLAEGTGGWKLDQDEEIQAVFHFMECLAQLDNHYQTAFKYLVTKLKELVFANPTTGLGMEVRKLADTTKNQFLIKFSYRNLGKTTYSNLCKQLLKQTQKTVQKMQEAMQKQQTGQQKNLQLIKQKQQLIKKLKRQLKYYQEHPSQDLYPYVKKLQRQNKQMKEEIQELLHLKNQNQYAIQIHQTSNLLLSEQIESLKGRIYQMELEELSGLKQVEKNSELKIFEDNVQTLKDMLDKSKLKMQSMKQQFQKMKDQNQKLINERSILAKRAAVGFGQLTPRPNIKAIFNENNLVYENYVRLSNRNTTTENIMKAIVEKLKKNEHSKGNKVEEVKNVVQEKFQRDQQMQNTINFIQSTKNQVRITSQSLEQVKRSVNKQKNDRQNLQKNLKGKK